MVDVPEVNLIECPDCKRTILDNVNYCRFCGHDFNEVSDESSSRLSRFIKNTFKGVVLDDLRYCTECKAEIRDFEADFCENCGAVIPYQDIKIFCSCGSVQYATYCNLCSNAGYKERLTSEEFYQMWHNQVIIPLSKEYNKDLSKGELKQFFNLNNEQYNHIVYRMIYSIAHKKIEGEVTEFFKTILEETKNNYEDIEKSILNLVKQNIKDMFNNDGISAFYTSTIKEGYNETIKTPNVKNKHGAGTKVLATAVAGPLGYVATSGVKQETETEKIYHKGEYFHSKVIITNKNVSYLTYTDQNSSGFNDNRTDISKIVVDWKEIKAFDDDSYFILHSGESFKCPGWSLVDIERQTVMEAVGSLNEKLNNKIMGEYYSIVIKTAKMFIIDLINEQIKSNQVVETNNNQTSELEALEKIMNMYKEGLLTDEEFTAMKQKFIGNSFNENSNAKFCGNCGAEVSTDSKFCTECGTQIN